MTVEARVNAWSLLALTVLRRETFENVQLERDARLSGIAAGLRRAGVWPKDLRKAQKENNKVDEALYPHRKAGTR